RPLSSFGTDKETSVVYLPVQPEPQLAWAVVSVMTLSFESRILMLTTASNTSAVPATWTGLETTSPDAGTATVMTPVALLGAGAGVVGVPWPARRPPVFALPVMAARTPTNAPAATTTAMPPASAVVTTRRRRARRATFFGMAGP